MSNSNTLAIDFGTSRTKVAYWDGEDARIWQIGTDHPFSIPSLFYLGKNNELFYGEKAFDQIDIDGIGVITTLKRRLRDMSIRGNGQKCTPLELLTHLLTELRNRSVEEIQSFEKQKADHVVLTIPAIFGIVERDIMNQAAKQAGFEKIELLSEPVAAARAWLAKAKGEISDYVVVFDCGGGTIDWACLQRTGDNFELLDTCPPGSDNQIGGEDVDRELLELLCECANDDGLRNDSVLLLNELRKQKERFCRDLPIRPIKLPDGRLIELPLSGIQKAIDERFIVQALKTLQVYISDVREKLNDTPTVLLVGGSGKLKGLKEATERECQCEVLWWEQSEYATVQGAAVNIEQAKATSNSIIAEDHYRGAVKMAWADKVLQPEEIAHLDELVKTLKIAQSTRDAIETEIIGQSISEINFDIIAERKKLQKTTQEKSPVDWNKLGEQKFELPTKAIIISDDELQIYQEIQEFGVCLFNYLDDESEIVDSEIKLWLNGKSDRWSIWEKSANDGNASAQYLIGTMYDYGIGVECDRTRALNLVRKAAEGGNGYGQVTLGINLYIEKNYDEAVKWLLNSTENDCQLAYQFLGEAYAEGNGVSQNYEESMKWFRKSATQGEVTGQWNLGLMYLLGQGIEQNYSEGMSWLRKAAEQGPAWMQHELGIMYRDGNNGVTENEKEGDKWLALAAERSPSPKEVKSSDSSVAGEMLLSVGIMALAVPVMAVAGVFDASKWVFNNLKPKPTEASKIGKFIVQDGVATDTETGLMWLRFAHGQRWENETVIGKTEPLDWHRAMIIAEIFNQQGYAGYKDWRVPNIDELKTLINRVKGTKKNYIDADVFPRNDKGKNFLPWLFDMAPPVYWSSSPGMNSDSSAWRVRFGDGICDEYPKCDADVYTNVRFVRG